jgi:hypothetical protein
MYRKGNEPLRDVYWDSGFGKIYCVGIELGQFEAVGMCRAKSVGEGLEIRRY